ncbi:hypothetical protein 3 [Changjiang crawfish virus 7]|uniref:hypothetical protein 3 n=1 Tax=Changjiang crawfish virus 7 TaxID=1922771 RepID=UPI00090C4A50|nr:hypothetical protein 3 [Changjiang crawfish virus 7]APG76239.1 hypothetical protein 3 [Changjiang crawfish virus 7]
MVKTKGTKGKGKSAKRVAKRPAMRVRGPEGHEARLARLIMDPCGAELTTGYALATEGLVQRFNRFITPVATTETNFAYIFNPLSHAAESIVQKLSTGTGAATNISSTAPGEAYLDANADAVSTVAACMQILYTGKLVDRKGYIGVCQAPWFVMNDIATGTTDLPTLLSYCQAIQPVGSETLEIKFSPTIRSLLGQTANVETSGGIDNVLMVVAIGVDPNQFVVKFTSVYEYVPKFALGAPAPRATKTYIPGAPERIVSTLDRLGHWWHNAGNAAAAAYRLGGQMVYGAGQAARLVSATVNTARTLRSAAVPLLALTG